MSEHAYSVLDAKQATREQERRQQAEQRQRESETLKRIRKRIGDAMKKWPSSNESDALSRFFDDDDRRRQAAAEIWALMQWLKNNVSDLECRIKHRSVHDTREKEEARFLELLRTGLKGTVKEVVGNLESLARLEENFRQRVWAEWFDLFRLWPWTTPVIELPPAKSGGIEGGKSRIGSVKSKGGRHRLAETDPKLQVYNRIKRERKPGERSAAVQIRLEADKDFMGLFKAGGLKWKTVFHNARVYFNRKRRECTKQQTPPY